MLIDDDLLEMTELSYSEIEKENKILKERCESQQMMLDMTSSYMKEVQQELESSKAKLSNAYQQMKDSINYAERIQKALLMSYDYFREIFPASFVYYVPKDILSGDFYWVYQEGTTKYVAAIDCTGHGVPGAMLTVLVNSLLVQIVKEQKVSDPQQILLELDRLVDTHLSDETHRAEVKDGLDMALCVFHTNEKKLYYAGAHLPIYLIRQNELMVYKGARYSLGDHSERNTLLHNQAIEIEEGDRIYLFSDGYIDQFGGENDTKFKSKHFKEFLLQHHQLPMQEQKIRLKENFIAWKGNRKQTDDVLVIGINY